jgi:hypothetical protein
MAMAHRFTHLLVATGAAFLVMAATIAVPLAQAAAEGIAPLGPLDAGRRVPAFIATGTPASGFRPGDRQLAQWALDAWQRAAQEAFRFEASPEPDALVRVLWAAPGEGQYGEMRALRANGRRGAAVYIRPDTDALGPAIAALARQDPLWRDTVVYLTCLHELGHAVGLSHTDAFADIMYAFGYGGDITAYFRRYRDALETRGDIARVSGLSPADIARVRAAYAAPAAGTAGR